ncbi:MAG: hypothetical protein A2096_16735 [Spirochaetes bacterium GWF1_41_5]|nr:MAG: hypothetical protein A2096_16735 [Spirochaetes bacterium GWF1_41_5]HBE03009.1 hypothetical protein [Spirochaetia bacterium]
MGRCKKHRCIRWIGSDLVFKPAGIPFDTLEETSVEPDEFEAMRLCDLEGKSQIEAASCMQISRGTVQRLLETGRSKLVSSILLKKAIRLRQ